MSHQPYRGSDVEAWIKRHRDRYPRTPWFAALDELLDDYRLRADVGQATLLVPETVPER